MTDDGRSANAPPPLPAEYGIKGRDQDCPANGGLRNRRKNSGGSTRSEMVLQHQEHLLRLHPRHHRGGIQMLAALGSFLGAAPASWDQPNGLR